MKQKKKAEVDNPGKLLMRILGYVGKTYKVHLILVVIGIFVSVLANVQGTMFMKTMIDDYIVPLLQADVPDLALCHGYFTGCLSLCNWSCLCLCIQQNYDLRDTGNSEKFKR